MKIISIEPTPSPNSMKINVDEKLPAGKSNNYTNKNLDGAPSQIQQLLNIEGVKSIYQVADFLALERNPRVDWQVILQKVRAVFGETSDKIETTNDQEVNENSFGEVKVLVQFFKEIPMQVKLLDGHEEKRFGLPDIYKLAAVEASKDAENIVLERKWHDYGVRYGSLDEVGEQVVEEIKATYDEERVKKLVEKAKSKVDEPVTQSKIKEKVTLEMLDAEDWRVRFAALEKMDPTEDDIPVLEKALADEKASIRRIAVVYLGMIESEKVLPLLYRAVLDDPAISVRRTAGDCLSDIGNPDGIPVMIKSLKDKNKLVRWRAAMFLFEVGDQTAIAALRDAQEDPEFEVAMQVKLALQRIEGGEEAKGSVWKQMTESRNKADS
ncbi:conserved virulence factor C family protein [Bacillus sp. Marseille-P3661]|uniref:conserved virulence factor C family protein n=1 Tax=Bacillus sp. Marseille-P3661 TaxID=1936234 RepID=UPI000C826BB4|nr:conserved virulence factor C family protein [Bacillus sp. Marseille-P3661]